MCFASPLPPPCGLLLYPEYGVQLLSLLLTVVHCRVVIDVWAEATTYPELCERIRALPRERTASFLAEDVRFKFHIHAFGRKYSKEQQVELMTRVSSVGIRGKAEMENPTVNFWILEDVGKCAPKDVLPRKVPPYPLPCP